MSVNQLVPVPAPQRKRTFRGILYAATLLIAGGVIGAVVAGPTLGQGPGPDGPRWQRGWSDNNRTMTPSDAAPASAATACASATMMVRAWAGAAATARAWAGVAATARAWAGRAASAACCSRARSSGASTACSGWSMPRPSSARRCARSSKAPATISIRSASSAWRTASRSARRWRRRRSIAPRSSSCGRSSSSSTIPPRSA